LAQITQKHPDLAELIKVWLELPEHIKALVNACGAKREQGQRENEKGES